MLKLGELTQKKQVMLGLALATAIIVVLGGIKFVKIMIAMASGNHGPPPEAVTSFVAAQETWPRTIEAVGSIASVRGATLSAEEPGRVIRIAFESGAFVKQGDLLLEIDPSVEEADLESAKAQADWQKVLLDRAKTLRSKGANSLEDLQKSEMGMRDANAKVESLQAKIARKKIVAPFSGRLGIRLVNEGQTISVGTPLVPLQSIDPIYVNFTLPQQALSALALGNKVEVKIDTFENELFEAVISAIDTQIDPVTRNVSIQGTIPNPEEKLRSGMFANVTVILSASDNVVTIPATSISYAPYGDSVYVIEKKEIDGVQTAGVKQQIVKLGRRQGDKIAVVSGINAGDEVVSSGVFKLYPGANVMVNNQAQPENKDNPKPADT